MQKYNVGYQTLDVEKDEEGRLLFDIRQTPTFLVVDGDKEVYRCYDVNALNTYLEKIAGTKT